MADDKHSQIHANSPSESGDKHQSTLPYSPPAVYGSGLVANRQYDSKYINKSKVNI